MTHDIKKLPKWAQDKISGLQRNLREAEHKLLIHAGDETRVVINEGFMDEDALFFAPDDCRVRFYVPGGRRSREWFEARLDGDRLCVSSGDSLVIYPRGSNVIELEVT